MPMAPDFPLLTTLVVVVTLSLWAFTRLPEYLTALLFFAAATILAIAPNEVIFSGFASPAFWLVLSGYVLGVALQTTGLADRIALLLSRHLRGSYVGIVSGVVLLTYLLAFIMPSNMGRITLLMPIVMSFADRLGLAPGRPGRVGLALAVGFGTYELSASILPANVPNLVMAGAAQAAYGMHFSYLPYLAQHAPVLGLGKALVIIGCIAVMFRDRPQPSALELDRKPLSRAEKQLGALLALTLLGWMTDSLHGISAAWIGLASACWCLLPRVGFVTSEQFATRINFRTILYVGGILGFASVVAASGLGQVLGRLLLEWIPLRPGHSLQNTLSLTGIATALNFVVTGNGLPALYTPLAQTFADASAMPLYTVLMIQVLGYATVVMPYQAAPIVVAMGLGGVSPRQGLRFSLATAALTLVVLAPLNFLWFQLLGMFPG